MHEIDVHLISDWAARVLEPGRVEMAYLHLTDGQRAALGRGFAALHAAVTGEDQAVLDRVAGPGAAAAAAVGSPDPDDLLAGALQQYLYGMAAGIAATGADRDPTSFVAGLVAGAAQLRFSWPVVARFGAVEIAERAGLAAADVSGDGAGLPEILRAVVETMDALVCLSCQPDHDELDDVALREPDDNHLSVVVVAVIEQLYHVVAPVTDPGAAQQVRPRSGCAPRRFLAEITCTVDASPAVHHTLQRTLDRLGTDLRVAPTATDDVHTYHLHTGSPGAVVGELFAVTTPFELEIRSLEPPLLGESG